MENQEIREIRRVHLLPPAVAERIAAGEVIERPASVVKELVENSIDAGATEILVLLENGGKDLIEILDNGHGMPREDLELCVQRHATSKLRSLEDLESIRSLGFRGEALPSVAAASELSILSRARDSSTGTAYEINLGVFGEKPVAKATTFGHFLSSPHGTRVQARGLFAQIPARLKFLKSQAAEVSQVREWIERLALAHPRIGFRLVSDDRQVLSLRPQEESARVRSILSNDEDYPLLTESAEVDASLRLRVHWLQGFSTPQTRRLVQVVNGRALRDRLLQQALLSPFRQALLPGQFPAVALYLEIDPAELDVNVHPTKTEIRFLDTRKVFRAVETLVERLIEKNGAPAVAPASSSFSPSWSTPPTPIHQQAMRFATHVASHPEKPLVAAEPSQTQTPEQAHARNPAFPYLPPNQLIGILFQTYLLYDMGQELVLIDQHAAHERIRYESLRRGAFHVGGQRVAPQALLIPEAVRFEAESRKDLEERLPLLAKLGFEAEIFGEDTLLFRSIPAAWGPQDLRTRLKSLVERALLIEDPRASIELDETLFEKLASEACHSAVRAGDRLEREEAFHLVDQLSFCEHPWNCPHGRPTLVKVGRGKLEEWFQRRV